MTSRPELGLASLQLLETGWHLTMTPAGAHSAPDALADDAIEAFVPGTVAEAQEKAGLFDRANPVPLDHQDAWYRLDLSEPAGEALLKLDGLGTFAEVFLNGERILISDSMFHAHEVPVTLVGHDQLAICFRALRPHLSRKLKRARWRTRMISEAGLRGIRTTLLGYMPGWCPEIHGTGPYRPISLMRHEAHSIDRIAIAATLDAAGCGHLKVSFRLSGSVSGAIIRCAGIEMPVVVDNQGLGEASLDLPGVEPWWPHTHGKPVLHDVELICGSEVITLGRTGFRHLAVDRQADGLGFQLVVNGEPVFCRGAVWTNADIVRLPGARKDYEPWLRLVAQAGMNMIRIGGTMTYETPKFFALCDELGIMVWQEAMLANFDYPAEDEAFAASFRREIETLLTQTRVSPSLVLFCGGSEVYQQAAMMGLPQRIWCTDLTEKILPELVQAHRSDILYVPNSPSGGPMPFMPNAGIGHYYGVGAYCRPLEDARRANVRFAGECLAFSHVPEQQTLDHHLPVPPVHHPKWKARVPRDRDASWDFEDIREHYFGLLYDVDPVRLRREDVSRYLDLSRAVTGEVIEATFAEWRRHGSSCGGALIWTLQDLMPGAGWGIIDSTGQPKPVWHAVRRAFRPIQVLLLDEGTNGLDVHVINETPVERSIRLDLDCLRGGRQRVIGGTRELVLEAHSSMKIPATDLFGSFFDTTYAYRFAAAQHEVTVATITDAQTGQHLADAFHFPRGRKEAFFDAELKVELVETESGFALDIETDRFIQSLQIKAEGYLPCDNWFHIAPGKVRRVQLNRQNGMTRPSGDVTFLGAMGSVRF